MLLGSASMTVQASPLAGAVSAMYDSQSETEILEKGVLAGPNLTVANVLSNIKQIKDGNTTAKVMSNTPDVVVAHILPEEAYEYARDTEVSAKEAGLQEDEKVSSEFENVGIAQVDDFVNIRKEPSEEADIAGKLYSNGAACVVGVDGDWVHIVSGNVEGYVKSDYIAVGNEELCLENSKILAAVNTDGLNVREESNTESRVINRAGLGEMLEVVDIAGENNEWVVVNDGDTNGYVSSEYVQVGRIYDSFAESKEEEAARLERERKAEEEKARENSNKTRSESASQASASVAQPAPAAPAAPVGGGSSAVANYALQFVGNPYVYGGSSLTSGTDCSGFTMSVYRNFGVSLPHSSSAQRGVGVEVGVAGMQPGDIVCYSGHVGLAIGGGQIVHASTPATGIKVSSAYYKPILAVRRVL